MENISVDDLKDIIDSVSYKITATYRGQVPHMRAADLVRLTDLKARLLKQLDSLMDP